MNDDIPLWKRFWVRIVVCLALGTVSAATPYLMPGSYRQAIRHSDPHAVEFFADRTARSMKETSFLARYAYVAEKAKAADDLILNDGWHADLRDCQFIPLGLAEDQFRLRITCHAEVRDGDTLLASADAIVETYISPESQQTVEGHVHLADFRSVQSSSAPPGLQPPQLTSHILFPREGVSPEVTSRVVTMKSDAEEDYQGWWKQTRDDPTMASGPWLPTTGAALALFVIESLLGFIATGFLIYAAAARIAKGRRPRTGTPPDYSHLAP